MRITENKESRALVNIIGIPSLVFVIWHPNFLDTPILGIFILLFGLIQCSIYEKSRSLIPLLVIHLLVNSIGAASSHYL